MDLFWAGLVVGVAIGWLSVWLRNSGIRMQWENRLAFMRKAMREPGPDSDRLESRSGSPWKH